MKCILIIGDTLVCELYVVNCNNPRITLLKSGGKKKKVQLQLNFFFFKSLIGPTSGGLSLLRDPKPRASLRAKG